jgi:hypothetical protein
MIARSAVILLYETLLADPSTKRQTAKTVQLEDLLGMWSNEICCKRAPHITASRVTHSSRYVSWLPARLRLNPVLSLAASGRIYIKQGSGENKRLSTRIA